MNIGVDIMGGDYAPLEAIQGIVAFLEQSTDSTNIHFTLFGDQYHCAPYIHHLSNYTSQFDVVHCPTQIGMNEHPIKALKEKTDSSILVGYTYLAQGKIDAFVGAGNTGAMMVAAMNTIKPIEGVLRPTIASPIPKLNGTYNFLLDVGANADCKADHLVQFAQMGSIYAKLMLQLNNPKVGLLNIGEEEGKGNLLAQAAYPLLKEKSSINFIGNIEGRDVFVDNCDVIVCEGFTGNVMLKMAESFYQLFKVNRKVNDAFLEEFNYELYGGTPLLGVNAPVIIGHGISRVTAFKNMYNTASKMITTNLVASIQQEFL